MTDPSIPSESFDPDWIALARLTSGEALDETASSSANPAHDDAHARLVGVLSALGRVPDPAPPSPAEIELALSRVLARREDVAFTPARTPVISLDAHRSRRRANAFRIAAAILVMAGAGALWRTNAATSVTPAVHYASAIGTMQNVTLSDGTHVLLAPGSTLDAASGFGGSGRDVTLVGEAQFDVVHNAAKPFVVHTSNASFRDVGTVFAVESDVAGGSRVVVREGSVAAVSNGSSTTVTLGAGDRAIVPRSGQVSVERSAVTESDLAWTKGQLVFRDTPIPEVVAELRRWYGVDLVVDSSLASRHLTATFDRNAGGSRADVGRVVAAALGGGLRDEGDVLRIVPAPAAPLQK